MKKSTKSKLYRIQIYCSDCHCHLYDYNKGMLGHLVKCYKDMIISDYTNKDLHCPKCGIEFAREAVYNSHPSNKIIQGKVYHKGHC